MNAKIWRQDKAMMLIVTSTGLRLLQAMDGKQALPPLAAGAFREPADESERRLGLNWFNLASEHEDWLLHSAVFVIALWSRGFIGLNRTEMVDQDAPQPLMALSVMEDLSKQCEQDLTMLHPLFLRRRNELLRELLNGDLCPVVLGEIEPAEEDAILDVGYPHYRVGYIKPSLFEAIGHSQSTGEKAACVAVTVVMGGTAIVAATMPQIGTVVGDHVGQYESRQP
jgi:hypothetical protein